MLAEVAVGTLAQYLTVVAVVGVAWLVYRGGGSAALGVLETANRVLETRVRELEKLSREDAAKIAELQASRDFTLALTPIVTAVEHHESAAAARFERMMTVQQMIADRLGPDTHADAG